ncbi:AAA family ATPase [Actinoplanes sp. CA-142083]|uniref:helix-turn-helix transcriptional regulator n=1 Tax=Actinoplanes sp. CA-142083 TaxID=3239903 RepID=UPI003D929429
MILGRRPELEALTTVLDAAHAGSGGALVLRGEAGIGKSALLEHAAAEAGGRGFRVLVTAGVQAEVHIPYAGLDRLLRAVGMPADPDSQPYRLAIALLEVLGEAGVPVLVAVEDAHWLDEASWAALSFLARRLGADPIAMVLTTRDGDDVNRRLTAAGLPERRLESLGPDDSAALVAAVAPGLGAALTARVLRQAAGNPLGLVELGEAAARSGGAALLPARLPLSERLEHTFSGLVAELPPITRALLLVAALDDGDDFDELIGACAEMIGAPVSADDIEPAVATRLVRVDDQFRVRFRHPLLRSALHQSATAAQRRRAHAALAGAVAANSERRVWHRAAAAIGPDEKLARELAETARRAQHRQVATVAVAAFERAARLSADPGVRGGRLLAAANAAAEQGDPATVVRLLAEVPEQWLTPTDRAWYGLLREVFLGTGWSGGDRFASFVEAVETMCREGDTDMALESLLVICLRVYWSVPDPETAGRLLAAAESVDVSPDDPRLVAVLAQVAPVTRGAFCLKQMLALRASGEANPRELYELGMGAGAMGAFSLGVSFHAAAEVELRAQGRIGLLAKSLVSHALHAAHLGDARSAISLAAEAERLTAESGESNWLPTAWIISGFAEALRGDVSAAHERADRAEAVLMTAGPHPLLALVRQVRGAAALAAGRPGEAFRELRRVFDPADASHHAHTRLMLLTFLAEAAMGCGALDELRLVADDLTPVAEQGRSPALIAGLRFARAVLGDSAGSFAEALADDIESPFERARLELAYGMWLRRQRRAAECRPLLRAAADTFDALGTIAWADRARAELRASGETLRRPAEAAQGLTPQELQIAKLAAEGLSNKDIADRLFLSPRTVTTHLSRIYPKLGIRSRGELSRALQTA